MSARAEIANAARAAAVAAVWRQWSALGAPISGTPTGSVVDPEALILLSCALRDDERRLDDVLAWWAGVGAALLSVQRARTLARGFPASSRKGLATFARAALDSGDTRWKALATGGGDDALVSRGKRGREPDLAAFPLLMLRLRAAFSVGVKADVLSVLITMGGTDATVRELVRATGYTASAVRRASQEMRAARVVLGTSNRPASYYADISAWSAFLGLDTEKRGEWRDLAGVFAFLADVIEWDKEGKDDGYVAASSARDIFEAHRSTFETNHILFPEPGSAAGARYLDVFGDLVLRVGGWLALSL